MKNTTILIIISILLCFCNRLFSQRWQYDEDRFNGTKTAYIKSDGFKFSVYYSPSDTILDIYIGDFYGCAGGGTIKIIFDNEDEIYSFNANCYVFPGASGRWFINIYQYGKYGKSNITVLDLLDKIKNSNRLIMKLSRFTKEFHFPLSGSSVVLNKVIPKHYASIYKRKMQRKTNKIAQDKKREYNSLLNKGDSLYDVELYNEAIYKYEKAKAHTKIDTNLLIIDKKIEEAKLKAEKYKQYTALINEGNSFKSSNQFDKAIEKYEQAKRLKPNSEKPEFKINETKQAQRNEQYNDLINEGNSLKALNQFNKAIEKYELAQKVKPNSDAPQLKIKETKQEADNHKKYDKLINLGDSLYNKKKYDKAIEKYSEAQKIMPNKHYETSQKINQARIKENEKSDNRYFILVGLGGALIYLSSLLF